MLVVISYEITKRMAKAALQEGNKSKDTTYKNYIAAAKQWKFTVFRCTSKSTK